LHKTVPSIPGYDTLNTGSQLLVVDTFEACQSGSKVPSSKKKASAPKPEVSVASVDEEARNSKAPKKASKAVPKKASKAAPKAAAKPAAKLAKAAPKAKATPKATVPAASQKDTFDCCRGDESDGGEDFELTKTATNGKAAKATKSAISKKTKGKAVKPSPMAIVAASKSNAKSKKKAAAQLVD